MAPRAGCSSRLAPAAIAGVLLALASAPVRAQPVNVPIDTNGNGTADAVVVDGDYDGDGRAEPEDIQAAIHALSGRLPGEAGSVTVRAGAYLEACRGAGDPAGTCVGDAWLACSSSADCATAGLTGSAATCEPVTCLGWDVRPYAGTGVPRDDKGGLIDIDGDDAGLTVHCDPGVEIRGIPNKRRFDGTSPPADAGGLGAKSARLLAVRATHDVQVEGCGLEAGMPRGIGAYDPVAQDWPLVADGGSATTLVDAAGGWLDGEWDRWWLLLRPTCTGSGTPHAWCTGAEEFVQIQASSDAGDLLEVSGFAQAPQAGDRYVVLYHSGGICVGFPGAVCSFDSDCGPFGPCDQSIDDDVGRGSRMTVYVSTSEDVTLRDLRVSGSSHSGVYAKNSRRVSLLDSELLENGGYYGHTMPFRPSIYWFSGNPDQPCFDGDTDCRFLAPRVEGNVIHHGGKGVNVRIDPVEGQSMGIEGLVVRNNHLHDLFAADGTHFAGVQCGGRDAVCEDNLIERMGQGVFVSGNAAKGWPSELPPETGGLGNAWGLSIRGNTIRNLWTENGRSAFGVLVRSGGEDIAVEDNQIEDVGRPGVQSDGIRLAGPNRRLRFSASRIGAVASSSVELRNLDGPVGGVGEWETWSALEVQSEDLGDVPAGFATVHTIERLSLGEAARVALVDLEDAGNRGGTGGDAEALYVSELVFEDASGLLDLNGLHLYVGSLDGDPAQIVDQSFFCPNGALDPGEECDDGNLVNGDGCWASCELEGGFALFGKPLGGGVSLVVDGVDLWLATTPGQPLASVLDALVAALLADPTLQGLGVGALRIDNRLVTTGSIESLELQDAGLHTALPDVPALGRVGLVAAAALLVVAAARRIRPGPGVVRRAVRLYRRFRAGSGRSNS